MITGGIVGCGDSLRERGGGVSSESLLLRNSALISQGLVASQGSWSKQPGKD